MERKGKAFTLLGIGSKHGLHLEPNLGIRMAIHKINIEKMLLINVYDINDIKNIKLPYRHSF